MHRRRFCGLSPSSWLLLLLVPSLVASQSPPSSPSSSLSYNCTYSAPLFLYQEDDDDSTTSITSIVTLEHYVNRYDQTITVRMRSQVGYYSWLGVGVTLDNGSMAPSLAVIGDVNRGIGLYALQSNDKDGSGVTLWGEDDDDDTNNGHLKRTPQSMFVQDEDDFGDETTTLVFTLDLVLLEEDKKDNKPGNNNKPGGEGPGAPPESAAKIALEISNTSTWIWAVGREGNRWEGKHKLHGSMTFDLYDGCQVIDQSSNNSVDANAVVPSPTEVPSAAAVVVPPPTVVDTTPAVPANPPPTTHPVNIPVPVDNDVMGDNVPMVHNNQQPGQFDDQADEDNDRNVFDELADGQDLETSLFYDTTRTYWLVHGVTLGIAWGVLAPLAVGAGLWRNYLSNKSSSSRRKKSSSLLWSRLHRALSFSVAILTLVGYLMAMLASRQRVKFTEGDGPLSSPPGLLTSKEGLHALFGMIILVLMLVQGLGEYVRRCFTQKMDSTQPRKAAESANQHPSAGRIMMVDGFPTVQQELPPPLGGEQPNGGDHPSDISLLTTSVVLEQMAILNLASMLGAESDTDHEDHAMDGQLLYAQQPFERDVSSLPDGSLEDFPINTDGISKTDDIDDGIFQKNDYTPETSPDTSREEVEVQLTPKRRRQSCCDALHQLLGACWTSFLLCLSLLILALAWYNCHTGIVLQFELADLQNAFFESILLAIFWGFAVGIFAVVLAMYCVAAQSTDNSCITAARRRK